MTICHPVSLTTRFGSAPPAITNSKLEAKNNRGFDCRVVLWYLRDVDAEGCVGRVQIWHGLGGK
jgi:hypothetical protein